MDDSQDTRKEAQTVAARLGAADIDEQTQRLVVASLTDLGRRHRKASEARSRTVRVDTAYLGALLDMIPLLVSRAIPTDSTVAVDMTSGQTYQL